MELVYAGALAFVTGVGVVVATEAQHRVAGPLGGLIAASPVTPTAALVLLRDAPVSLVAGIPSVAATLLAMFLALRLQRRGHRAPIPWTILAVVPPVALLATSLPLVWVVLAVPVLAWAAQRALRPWGPARRLGGSRLPIAMRFLVGFVAVGLVALSKATLPQVAPLVALFPVLFLASLAVVHWGSGNAGSRSLAHGGVVGSIGVAAFAVAAQVVQEAGLPVAVCIAAGWAAYVGASTIWLRLFRVGPTPVLMPHSPSGDV